MTALTASGNVTNTGAATLTAPNAILGQDRVTIQMNLAKVSGTVAGTAAAQASLDNVNWYTLTSTQGGASYTNTDIATNIYIWFLTPAKAPYFRILITGTGTMVGTPTGSIY